MAIQDWTILLNGENELILALSFSVLILAVLQRAFIIRLYSPYFKQGLIGDAAAHAIYIDELRRYGWKIKKIKSFLVENGEIAKPFLFHKIASIFSKRLTNEKQYFINAMFFVIASLFLFLYSYYLAVNYLPAFEPLLFSVMTVGLFFINPKNLIYAADDINYIVLSERYLARISSSAFFLSIFANIEWGDTLSILLALFFSVVSLLVSQFSRQSVLLGGILLGIFTLSITVFSVLTTSIVFAIIMSKREFLDSLKSQFEHLLTLTKDIGPVASSAIKKIVFSFRDFQGRSQTSAKIKYATTKEPIRLLLYNFELVFLLFFVWLTKSDISYSFVPIVMSASIIYLLVTIKLYFIGEPHRYFHYIFDFLSPFLIACFLMKTNVAYLYVFAIASVLLAFAYLKLVFFGIKYPSENLILKIFSKFEFNESSRVWTTSMPLGTQLSANFGCKVFRMQPGNFDKYFMSEFLEFYPVMKTNISDFVHKYNITHIVVDKNICKHFNLRYDVSEYRKIYEDGQYIVCTTLVKRYICLPEHPIGSTRLIRPTQKYLENKETLENKEYELSIDKDGFILPGARHTHPDLKIAFFGDSFSETTFVEPYKRFAYLSGKLFEEASGLKTNTYNAAISGCHTLHSINLLINKVEKVKPDIAIAAHGFIDLGTCLTYGAYWDVNNHPYSTVKFFKHNSDFNSSVDNHVGPDVFLDVFYKHTIIFVDICLTLGIKPILIVQPRRLDDTYR